MQEQAQVQESQPSLELMTSEEIAAAMQLAGKLRQNIASLFCLIGKQDTCKACHAPIWFVLHRNGKWAPYTADAVNHFVTCPHAQRFKSTKGAARNNAV